MLASAVLPLFAAACNLMTEPAERAYEGPDVPAELHKRSAADQAPALADGGLLMTGADAGVPARGTTISVPVRAVAWTSLNDAGFSVADGPRITSFAANATHPIIVPVPQPAITADDYTVTAVVRANADGEFGIVTRLQPDGSGVVVGSEWGQEPRPFIGVIRPPDWSPSEDDRGPAYTVVAGARYTFKIRVAGSQVLAKMWSSTQPEPPTFNLITALPWSTGRGIGFYTYGVVDAVLESAEISVP